MHSFVARLRGRAVSQSTTISAQSEEPRTPDTPTFPSVQPALITKLQQPVIDRKILPEVNELLDSYSAAEVSTSSGLSPRPVKQRSPIEHAALTGNLSEANSHKPDARSASPSQHSQGSLRNNRGSFSRLSQRLASSQPWSSFARNKDPAAPRLSQLEHPPSSRRFHFGSVDTFAIPRRSRSSRSVAAFTVDSCTSADHTRQTSRASESSSWIPPQSIISSHRRSLSMSAINPEERVSQPLDSSTPTTASRKTSTKRSVTTQSSSSAQSHAFTVHTPILQVFDVDTRSDSPHTFGQGSPPLRLSAFLSPELPMPPLSSPDPGFAQTLAARSEPTIRDLSNVTQEQPSRCWAPSLHGKTFPPRGRRKTTGSRSDENYLPFPSNRGRALRAHASFPAVRHLFEDHSPTTQIGELHSGKSSRRFSANWNAHQAAAGVLSNSIGDYGWPAEVSKEIIRLSLNADRVAGKTRERETEKSVNADITQRVCNVPLASEGDGRACPPLFSPNFSPLSKAGKSEGGDKTSSPQSQAVDPGLIQPAGVVEGKRSMSVRNGFPLSTLNEDGDDLRQPETVPKAATIRPYRKSILRQTSSVETRDPDDGPSSLQNVAPVTPSTSRRSSLRHPARHSSEPTLTQVPETPPKKGKRKAEDVDLTPPDPRNSQHTTFAIPPDHRRTHHQSEPSRAPSAYQRKRVRLSSSSPAPTPSHSRPSSSHQNTPNVTGTPSSRISNAPPSPAVRALSRAASSRSIQPSVASLTASSAVGSRRDRRRSLSDMSIPIGAIVTPQPPSLTRSSIYHMHDPRRPPRTHPTPWSLHVRSADEDGSPVHAWMFFIGFILFPLWWLASFLPIPRTRHVGGSDTEKAVTLDDPQVEHDARSWRLRCRIMAGISFLTYIPFIVLVAIFASR